MRDRRAPVAILLKFVGELGTFRFSDVRTSPFHFPMSFIDCTCGTFGLCNKTRLPTLHLGFLCCFKMVSFILVLSLPTINLGWLFGISHGG